MYYKQEGLQPTKLHDIKECPSGASIQLTASDGAVDKHLAKETAAETFQGQSEAAKGQTEAAKSHAEAADGHAEAGKDNGSSGASMDASKGHPREETMSLKDEAKLDIESEEMERKCNTATNTGW